MAKTVFEIESEEQAIASPGKDENINIAVSVTAVLAYMNSQNAVSTFQSNKSHKTSSNWVAASRLEDINITKQKISQRLVTNSRSLWIKSSSPLLLTLLLFFFSSLCSYSQNVRSDNNFRPHTNTSEGISRTFLTERKRAGHPEEPKPRHPGKKLLERIWWFSKSKRKGHLDGSEKAERQDAANSLAAHAEYPKPKSPGKKLWERIQLFSKVRKHRDWRSSEKAQHEASGKEKAIQAEELKQKQQSNGKLFDFSNRDVIESDKRICSVPIRVALALNCARVELDAIDGAEIRQAPSGSRVAVLPARTSWSMRLEGESLAFINKANHRLTQFYKPSIPVPQSNRIAHLAYRSNTDNPIHPLPEQKMSITQVAYYPAAPPTAINVLRFPLGADGYSHGDNHKVSAMMPQYYVVPHSLAHDNTTGAPVFACNGKLYRGSLWLKTGNNGLSAINIVELEDYLLSVVPSEMPSSWPDEALKAQAIAARSYAMANIGKHAKDGYDVQSTVYDQVYSGVGSETETTNKAVAETEGMVLKHKGQVISAFFHSTSGGATEQAENVWGKSLPFVKSVPDYDDLSPHFSWQRQFKVAELGAALARNTLTDVGKLLSLTVVSRSSTQRLLSIELCGTRSTQLINGETLRHPLHLPSTIFNVTCDNGSYTFSGRGFGHGVGLSQWGAKALAEFGYNAAQILAYYYKDVSLTYLNETSGI